MKEIERRILADAERDLVEINYDIERAKVKLAELYEEKRDMKRLIDEVRRRQRNR